MRHFWMGVAVVLMVVCCPNVMMAQKPVKSVKRVTAVPQRTPVGTSQGQNQKVKAQENAKMVKPELREEKGVSKTTLERKNMSAFEEAEKYGGKKSSIAVKKADTPKRATKAASKKRAKRVNRTKVRK